MNIWEAKDTHYEHFLGWLSTTTLDEVKREALRDAKAHPTNWNVFQVAANAVEWRRANPFMYDKRRADNTHYQRYMSAIDPESLEQFLSRLSTNTLKTVHDCLVQEDIDHMHGKSEDEWDMESILKNETVDLLIIEVLDFRDALAPVP